MSPLSAPAPEDWRVDVLQIGRWRWSLDLHDGHGISHGWDGLPYMAIGSRGRAEAKARRILTRHQANVRRRQYREQHVTTVR